MVSNAKVDRSASRVAKSATGLSVSKIRSIGQLDMAHENSDSVMVDSKDAKAAIQSDVSPVQKAGTTWKKDRAT